MIRRNGERDAIVADAGKRLSELRNVQAILWPDRDDPMVLSELCVVQSCIRCAEQALKELGADG